MGVLEQKQTAQGAIGLAIITTLIGIAWAIVLTISTVGNLAAFHFEDMKPFWGWAGVTVGAMSVVGSTLLLFAFQRASAILPYLITGLIWSSLLLASGIFHVISRSRSVEKVKLSNLHMIPWLQHNQEEGWSSGIALGGSF